MLDKKVLNQNDMLHNQMQIKSNLVHVNAIKQNESGSHAYNIFILYNLYKDSCPLIEKIHQDR